MRIPFEIKYRPQIESGEYKVETRDGRPVRIICWDCINKHYPIIALALYGGEEISYDYTNNGHYYPDDEKSEYDLFIVTPEPELSEFEKAVGDIVKEAVEKEVGDNAAIWAIGRGHTEKLLALAREELMEELELDGKSLRSWVAAIAAPP